MKKKLYYTIERGLDPFGESLDGNKYVTMYTIENNEPKKFGSLDLLVEENTTGCIEDYLNDNGYGDDDIELILL